MARFSKNDIRKIKKFLKSDVAGTFRSTTTIRFGRYATLKRYAARIHYTSVSGSISTVIFDPSDYLTQRNHGSANADSIAAPRSFDFIPSGSSITRTNRKIKKPSTNCAHSYGCDFGK